jgi:hypothetical protein
MKLVVPFTYHHPTTARAVDQWPGPVEWHYVGNDDDDYLDLLRKLLAEREPFALCEHDVVATRSQLFALTQCTESWCAWLYREEQRDIGPPLGLCKFGRSWLEANQHLFDGFIRGESWTRLNQWVNDHAVGIPHLHGPPWVRNDSRRPVPAV